MIFNYIFIYIYNLETKINKKINHRLKIIPVFEGVEIEREREK